MSKGLLMLDSRKVVFSFARMNNFEKWEQITLHPYFFMKPFFKVFIEFVAVLLLFYVLTFWLQGM